MNIGKRKNLLLIFTCLLFVIGLLFLGLPTNTAFAVGNREEEGNNTAGTANSIAVNTYVSGYLSDNGDVDWYKFTVDQKGWFYVDFNHDDLGVNVEHWRISLYDTLYDSTAIYGIDGGNDYFISNAWETNTKTPTFGVEPGTYYIKISPEYFYLVADYEIRVNFTASNDWETENNNYAVSADEVMLNRTYYGALTTQSDEDWYKVTIGQKGWFNVEFNHTAGSSSSRYWEIWVYDYSGEKGIDGHDDYTSVEDNVTTVKTNSFGVDAGTYYVKIKEDAYSSNNYSVKVNFKASNDWETENNNEASKADEISLNHTYNGTLNSRSDVDWYKVTVDKDTQIAVTFNHDRVEMDSTFWTISIYDYATISQCLLSWGSRGYTTSATSEYIQVEAGTYYVKVDRDSYIGVDYAINIVEQHDCAGVWKITQAPTCTDGGSEMRACSICGQIVYRDVEPAGHQNDEGTVLQKATIFKKGETEYKCQHCGLTETETENSKFWILPVVIVGGGLFAFGLVNYIRMMKKKD